MRKLTIQAWEKETGVRFTRIHGGKMDGMLSLSTSPLINSFCYARRQVPGSICEDCYSVKLIEGARKNMQPKLKKNYEILTGTILDVMPILNARFARLEAFGDIATEEQVINYFNICRANRYTKFALFTKNPFLIARVLENGMKKPKNLRIMCSSYFKNRPMEFKFDFVDGIFTVFDKEFVEENGIEINCGNKKCMECLKCYNSTGFINVHEQLKMKKSSNKKKAKKQKKAAEKKVVAKKVKAA